jgi:hypothetical protein
MQPACSTNSIRRTSYQFSVLAAPAASSILRATLDIAHPLLVEDGSAALIPRGYCGAPVRGARVGPVWEVLEFGRTRSRVIDSIAAIASRLDITVEMPTPLTESRGLFHGTIMGLRSRTWI